VIGNKIHPCRDKEEWRIEITTEFMVFPECFRSFAIAIGAFERA
jgi:hypothetical protein